MIPEGANVQEIAGYPPSARLLQDVSVLSLFAGCGGLDLGFEQAGYTVAWANEHNSYAADTYCLNMPHASVSRESILDLDVYSDQEIPDGDLILGGFPCQDFSVIWKRPGINGDRGSLYKEFLRFVDAKKPKAFVAENVKGLLSANGGKAIETIISDFENITPGYVVHIKLFNFADYGVPQLRERVVLVGIRSDTCFEYEFPTPTHGPKANANFVTAGDALRGVESVGANSDHMNIAPRTIEILKRIPEGGNFASIDPSDPFYVKGMISHVYRRINRSEPAKTIIAAGGGGTWGYHYPEPRALTNRERARLQSFPDNFIFSGSFGEIRRQIGNAVPPKAGQIIAHSLAPLFSSDYEKIDLGPEIDRLRILTTKERIARD